MATREALGDDLGRGALDGERRIAQTRNHAAHVVVATILAHLPLRIEACDRDRNADDAAELPRNVRFRRVSDRPR
jgi:hypothetical protein